MKAFKEKVMARPETHGTAQYKTLSHLARNEKIVALTKIRDDYQDTEVEELAFAMNG
jgi:hypothetical protein